MAEPLVGVFTCTHLMAEVQQALKAIGKEGVPLRALPSLCHLHCGAHRPTGELVDDMLTEVDHVIATCMNCVRPGERPGEPSTCLGAIDHPRVSLIPVESQGELFLEPDIVQAATAGGAYFVLPAWLKRWREIVVDAWGFDEETAPMFFKESSSRLLFLDSGVPGDWQELLDKMSAFTGLKAETRVVGTERLQALFVSAFEQAQRRIGEEAFKAEMSRLRATAADHGVVMDFISQIGNLLEEDAVIAQLKETTHILFAPEGVRFEATAVADDEAVEAAPEDDSSSGASRDASSADGEGNSGAHEGQEEPASQPASTVTPDENHRSLRVELRHGPSLLGTLYVDNVDFPEHLPRYLPMARILANAAALALNASRLHRRERSLVSKLRETVKELDAFVYIASHDLQEPLRTITGFCDILREDLGELPEQAEQSMGFIVNAASRMRTLILSLLELSRAGRRPRIRRTISLERAADQALDALHGALKDAKATVDRDPLPTVKGDGVLLAQLYQNLIGNALKFKTDAAPHIRLTVEQGGDGCVLGVKDNGIGIDPRRAEVIFEPFRRLHGVGAYEGSGIGLSICRKVVERHGGRIWVDSAPGEGAHFRFTLG